MWKVLSLAMACLSLVGPALAATPPSREADFVVEQFRFRSGEVLRKVTIHYTTMGEPRRDAAGRVNNAVLLLHGTGGTGHQFFRDQFAGELFGPGQALDASRYFIIMPDDLGHGASSKPSDGLHSRFPHYDYDDMVELEHRLVTDGLKVERLRLILGTSMGCMHGFIWGETWPDAMDAIAPFACLPVRISGRNRLWRDMAADAIRTDPAWMGGDYTTSPRQGLLAAQYLLSVAGSAPHQMATELATQAEVDGRIATLRRQAFADLDANDLLYQLDSSRNYDPSAKLETIKARVLWINSADDFINPPELGVAEREARRLKNGRFILLPIGPDTHGHSTHTWAVNWKKPLADLLAATAP